MSELGCTGAEVVVEVVLGVNEGCDSKTAVDAWKNTVLADEFENALRGSVGVRPDEVVEVSMFPVDGSAKVSVVVAGVISILGGGVSIVSSIWSKEIVAKRSVRRHKLDSNDEIKEDWDELIRVVGFWLWFGMEEMGKVEGICVVVPE